MILYYCISNLLQSRELVPPVPIDPVVLSKSQLIPLKESARNQNLTLLDIQLRSCPVKHVEKCQPVLVSMEARGITFHRCQRKQPAQCPWQMAAPHPAPIKRMCAGREVGAAVCLGDRALNRRWEYNFYPLLAVSKWLPKGCFLCPLLSKTPIPRFLSFFSCQ